VPSRQRRLSTQGIDVPLQPVFEQCEMPAPTFFSRFAGTTMKPLSRQEIAMPLTVEQIADEALALPSEARALLADRLVESLDPAEDGYIRQLWMREAKRRVDEVRRGKVQAVPAEAAFAEVRRAIAR